MKLKLFIKITAFFILLQCWMPYFSNVDYVEKFFKVLAIYLCLSYYEQSLVEDKLEKSVAVFLMWLCVSNLFDELFFNPREWSWNEIAGALFALVLSIAEYKGWGKVIKDKYKVIKVRLTTKSK